MNLLVIDSFVPYVNGRAEELSLLMLPLGGGAVLGELARQCMNGDGKPPTLTVAPSFAAGPGYERALQRSVDVELRVLPLDRLGRGLPDASAWDDILVVDPRYWPVCGYAEACSVSRDGNYRGATHVVAVGGDPAHTRERVECDANGRVQRVQRLYFPKTWPSAATQAVCVSRVPARDLFGRPFAALTELRSKLSEAGVLSRDLPLVSDVFDLGRENGLLALSEQVMRDGEERLLAAGFVQKAPQVWAQTGARIHASAKVVGPVILHAEAHVREGATVIGPTVLGSRSQVGRGAIVAHSVLARQAKIAAGRTIRERVVAGCPSDDQMPADAAGVSDRGLTMTIGGIGGGGDPLLAPHPSVSRRRKVHETVKRAVDVSAAVLGLIVGAPIFVIVAILIKLDSRGPVLFGHRREQKDGKDFSCWKFRTMVADADARQRELRRRNEVDGPQFKMRDDPRVTRVGRFLRASNIDELPQLMNVLLGHMSLVGPRPSPFPENQICVPWRKARLSVRPGITGLWQICRDEREGGDFHQWIFYDLLYVRHLSIWLDIKIVLATLFTLGGRWRVPHSWFVPVGEQFGPQDLPTTEADSG